MMKRSLMGSRTTLLPPDNARKSSFFFTQIINGSKARISSLTTNKKKR